MSGSLAYFITFTCYGARLHGNPNGSVERLRDGGGVRELAIDRPREQHERSLLVAGPASLEASQRQFVARAIEGVAEFRGWTLWALNVRSNHVHVVVSAPVQPERVMNAFKSWATRRLREAGPAAKRRGFGLATEAPGTYGRKKTSQQRCNTSSKARAPTSAASEALPHPRSDREGGPELGVALLPNLGVRFRSRKTGSRARVERPWWLTVGTSLTVGSRIAGPGAALRAW